MQVKRILTVAIGLLIGLIGVEATIRALDPWIPGPSTWPTASTHVKTSQLSDVAPEVEVLLVGSSITEAAVDPGLLVELTGHEFGYNAAIPFFSPYVAETWLRPTLHRPDFKPDVAIIGLPIFPGQTEQGARSFAAWLESARQREKEAEDPLFPAILSHRGVFTRWDLVSLWEEARDQGFWTRSGHFTAYYEEGEIYTDLSAQVPRSQLAAQEELALRNLVNTLQHKGAMVAVVIEPGRFPGGADPLVVAAFLQSIQEIAADSDAEYWNAYQLDWDSELYVDTFHFNQDGMQVFTRHLAERIREWN